LWFKIANHYLYAGEYGGSGIKVMLFEITNSWDLCQPALSIITAACLPVYIFLLSSNKNSLIALVLI
jgi:hypothetical protein